MAANSLKVSVNEIKGTCPVYKKGDIFWILEGFKLDTDKGLCMHSLSSIMPYYVALSKGVSPQKLGLSESEAYAYLQCLDPCEYTGGGTVVFEVELK